MARVMEVTTALGDDVLLFRAMQGREELSRVSEFRLDLISERGDVDLDKLLGTPMGVQLANADNQVRHFSGYVTRISQVGTYGRYHRYMAVVRPWLWFLSRTADCRIFQDQTVPDIIKGVFADHQQADVVYELTETYRKWTYCVQYRETDLNFVSRLMEQEGIYYYFRHASGKNTLVLTDSNSKHSPVSGYAKLPFSPAGSHVRPEDEHVSSWEFSREIQPGVYVHDDYDLLKPSVEIQTRKAVTRDFTPGNLEIYDYPGEYVEQADGEHYAQVRIDELGTEIAAAHASTNARGIAVGALFSLEKSPRSDQNREHLIVGASYELEYGGYESLPPGAVTDYRCSFTAMSTKQQFRPKRVTPKPIVQGPQTAVVVGPSREEIFTDEYGRVKVQFHWDRRGKKDDKSSCWLRVSSPWAGNAWGAISTPRIGQEVVVGFLEGDPDQPLVTGRLYNKEQMPPYPLPANKTQSGMKSRSSKEASPENFNEIRFEDLKGSEQLFIHAEKNQDIEVENDETHWVGHDRTKKVDNDESVTIGKNRTESVGTNESITIGKNRTENVGENENISIGKNRTETVGDNESVSVGKNRSLDVAKDETIAITGARTDQVGKKRDTQIGEDDVLQIGKKWLVNAGDQITIQTGSASITMKKDGTIQISGKDITINGSGKINVKASSDVVIKGSKVTQN